MCDRDQALVHFVDATISEDQADRCFAMAAKHSRAGDFARAAYWIDLAFRWVHQSWFSRRLAKGAVLMATRGVTLDEWRRKHRRARALRSQLRSILPAPVDSL